MTAGRSSSKPAVLAATPSSPRATARCIAPAGRTNFSLVVSNSIATLSADEWETLCAVARMLDEKPRAIYTALRSSGRSLAGGDKPGDRYNAATSWETLLPASGWTINHRSGPTIYWTRPGKDRGVSASTNYQGNDLLWVFTSSTELDPDRSYDRFGFYTVMEHAGDFRAAARAFAAPATPGASHADGSDSPPVRGRRPVINLTPAEFSHAR